MLDVPTICHRLIVEWRTRAGKNKDWRISPIRDLMRKDNLRGREIYERRHVPSRAISWLSRNMLQISVFTATRLHVIPRDMLRSFRHNAAKSDSRMLLDSRHSTKRMPKYDCDKRPRYLDSERKAKREHAINIKDIICEGIALHRVAGHSDSEVVDTTIETDENSASCPPSDNIPPSKSVIFAEPDTRAAAALSIPYESRIGAIVGGRFVLRGLISTKLCYDVHAATDVCTDMVYTAKAYSIRGTKGNQRKYRLMSIKRNASKATCVASIDHCGRKWLFFSGGTENLVDTGSTDDASAWYGEEQYQHHFPVLSLRCATCTIAHTPFRKTYAACVREVVLESNDLIAERRETSCVQDDESPSEIRGAKRKERVRDRQRNKRKLKRVAKAAARKATSDEAALPEVISTSVNTSRTASRSHVDPELRTFSIAGLSDEAEFKRFLDSLDGDTLKRLNYGIDKRLWKHILEDPAETSERQCIDVSLGFRTLTLTVARINEVLDVLDIRMWQSLVGNQDIVDPNRFRTIEEAFGLVTDMRTNMKHRVELISKMEDLVNKKGKHLDTIMKHCENVWSNYLMGR